MLMFFFSSLLLHIYIIGPYKTFKDSSISMKINIIECESNSNYLNQINEHPRFKSW